MRLLIYTNHLGKRTANATAITIMTSDLARFLKSKGQDVLVVGNRNLIEEDIKFDYVYIGGGDILRAYKLASIIKEFQPDIIYAFMRPQSLVLALSTIIKKFDACYVGSVHNTDNYIKYSKALYLPYRIFIKHLFERLDYIACPSRAVVEELRKTYFIKEEKLYVVNNFIDYERIDKLSQENVEVPDEYIVSVGRLEEQKNYKSLLRVFYKVHKEFPKLWLVIVGEGSQRAELETLSHQLGITHRVLFVGYQQNPWKYIKRAKIFVLTSWYEAGPQVMLEAMYLRVPVVSYSIPSVVEQSDGGRCALLVPAYEEESMAEALIKVLKGEVNLAELSEDAYKRALEFSTENFVNKILGRCYGKPPYNILSDIPRYHKGSPTEKQVKKRSLWDS